jgi:hypothetical protein
MAVVCVSVNLETLVCEQRVSRLLEFGGGVSVGHTVECMGMRPLDHHQVEAVQTQPTQQLAVITV